MQQVTSCRVNDGVCEDENQLTNFAMNGCSCQSNGRDENLEELEGCHDKECHEKSLKHLSYPEIGLAKLSGFCDWFSHHAIIRESEDAGSSNLVLDCQKMVIFAHHLKVLDGIQVKIAIIGITAGGVGLDFSAAQNVVFLELPKSASEMLQDTVDESHWLHLNKSLYRVSSMINGKDNAIQEIEVDRVLHLDYFIDSSSSPNLENDTTDGVNCENSVKEGTKAIKLYSGASEECRGSTSENIEEEKNSSIKKELSQFETVMDQHLNSKDYTSHDGNVEVSDCQTIHQGQSITVSNCIVRLGARFDSMENFVNKAESMHYVKDEGASELIETDADCPIQVESLRFEVSQYTGRIHLYICVSGKDLRPRPLFINFRQEDLESMAFSAGDMKNGTDQHLLKENPGCCRIFQTFSNEWNGLRPIQQNKLLGKPLQLPLSLELCYLKESINHGSGGLLKGGSNIRVTPLSSISFPLPEHAIWKKVSVCSSTSKEKEYLQAWTISDEPLCKLCQQQCNGKLAKKPEYFEDLFCNLNCFQEYRIRTSQGALREELFQLEHGVCTQCKLDCHNLVKCIKPLSIARRKEYIENVAPKLAEQTKLFDRLIYEPVEGNAWHADHIVPVYKGGGECRLENMRTLCVVCHAEVTKAQQTERKLAKQRAKEQLKNMLKELKDSEHMKHNNADFDGIGDEAVDEDVLFVKVPGSAYSRTEN